MVTVTVSKKILKFVTLHQLLMGKTVTVQGHNELSNLPKSSPLKKNLMVKNLDNGNPESLLQMYNPQPNQIPGPGFFISADGDLYIERIRYYSGEPEINRIMTDTFNRNRMIYVTQNGYIVEKVSNSPSTRSTNPPPYAKDPYGNIFIDENKFNEIIAVPGLDDSGMKQAMVEVLRSKTNAKVIVTRTSTEATQPGNPNPVVSVLKEITDETQLNIVPQPDHVVAPTPAPLTDGFNIEQCRDLLGNIHISNSVFSDKVGHKKDIDYFNQIWNYVSTTRNNLNQGNAPMVLLAAHNYGTVEKYNWRINSGKFTGYDNSSKFKDFELLLTVGDFAKYATDLLDQKLYGSNGM